MYRRKDEPNEGWPRGETGQDACIRTVKFRRGGGIHRDALPKKMNRKQTSNGEVKQEKYELPGIVKEADQDEEMIEEVDRDEGT